MPKTHVIQRQQRLSVVGKPEIRYMKADNDISPDWVESAEDATKYEPEVARGLAFAMSMHHELAGVGPTYWAMAV